MLNLPPRKVRDAMKAKMQEEVIESTVVMMTLNWLPSGAKATTNAGHITNMTNVPSIAKMLET